MDVNGASSGTQWTATIGVTLPIFDRLVNYSNARSNAHLRSAAEASQVQEERQALGTYETQRRTFEIAVASAVARERTLEIARRIYRDSLLRFRSGRASSNDLLLDETRLTSSETLANQGWASAHMALAGFCHSVGRRLAGCL
jgi:outer membrane protein TolC